MGFSTSEKDAACLYSIISPVAFSISQPFNVSPRAWAERFKSRNNFFDISALNLATPIHYS